MSTDKKGEGMMMYEWDEPVPGQTRDGEPVTVNRVVSMTRDDVLASMRDTYAKMGKESTQENVLIDDFLASHWARTGRAMTFRHWSTTWWPWTLGCLVFWGIVIWMFTGCTQQVHVYCEHGTCGEVSLCKERER